MVVGGSPRVHLLSESHIAPTAEAPEQLCLVVLLAWGILACRATLPEGQVLVHAVVFAPALPAPSHARAVSGCGSLAVALPSLGAHSRRTETPGPAKGEVEYGSSSSSTEPTACGDGPPVLPAGRLRAGDALACPDTRRAGLAGDHRL